MSGVLKENNSEKTAIYMYRKGISGSKYDSFISAEEEIETFCKYKYQEDSESFEELVNRNLRFVFSVARNVYCPGMPLLDRIQSGNLGLIEGINRFDETIGSKITSYSSSWIKKFIFMDYTKYYAGNVRRLSWVIRDLQRIRKVTEEYIANNEGITPKDGVLVRELNKKYSNGNGILYKGDMLSKVIHNEISFQDRRNRAENTIMDKLEDPNSEDPTLEMDKESQKHVVKEELNKLGGIDSKILEMCFGIGGEKVMNLREIGKELNLSSQAVGQRRIKILEKFKHGHRARLLRQHLLEL